MTRKYIRKTTTRRTPRSVFKPGDPRINRLGRKKGSKNKFSGELKQLILNSLANAHKDGSQGWLQQLSKKNPRAFASLLSKLLPTKIGNEEDKPFQTETIQRAQAGLANLSDAELKLYKSLLQKIGIIQ